MSNGWMLPEEVFIGSKRIFNMIQKSWNLEVDKVPSDLTKTSSNLSRT